MKSYLWFDTEVDLREPVAANYDNALIEDWDLPQRTKNFLQKANYLTVGDLLRAGPEMVNVYGFGTVARDEVNNKIKQVLEEHKIDLDTLPIVQQNLPFEPGENNRFSNANTKSTKQIENGEPYWYENDQVIDRGNSLPNLYSVPITSWN